MSTIDSSSVRAGLAALLGAVGLSGCATTGARLDTVLREDPAQAAAYVVVTGAEAAGLVSVFRDGRLLDVRPPLALQPGDEVETAAGGAALIVLPNGGSAVVDSRSRVRVGSLEVLFGRVFAAVRGLFSVESENVVAGVEGTEFVFEVGANRGVHVVVLDGVVVCTSKTGRWAPTRLRSGLGFSTRPGAEAPLVAPASQNELDGIRAWVRRVISAAGGFASPAPPGYGWCCDAGRVTSGTRSQCRGKFYDDRASAQRACTPAEPMGWCCDAGRLTSGTRSRCGGTFYTDRASAEKACAPPKPGWCCLPGYKVAQMTSAACTSRKGKFYSDQRTANAACTVVE